MTAPNRAISAGNQLAFWGRMVDGLLSGISASVGNGLSGEGMRQVLGIQSANPGPNEPEDVDIPGDDGSLGKINFGPAETPEWIMNVGAFDFDTHARLQGTSVEAFGDIKMGVLQPDNPDYIDICLIYQAKAKSKDSANSGAKAWFGYIIPYAQAVPLGRAEFAGRAPAVDRYKVTAQVATKKPWGITILDSDLGTTGAPIIEFTSDNPITMHRFNGNGTTGPFVLEKTPISAVKTKVIKGNGEVLTPTTDYTVDVATHSITTIASVAASTSLVVLYEFAP